MKTVVLTPTYNRPDNLKQLFATLQQQNRKDFLWIIVNDGSKADYGPVVEEIKKEADFDVEYLRKENGGKSSAINYAFDHIAGKDAFVIIIDDDEKLYLDATEKVSAYVAKYKNTNIGAINFCRAYPDGQVIARPVFEKDVIMTFQEFKGKKYFSDGYIGYFLGKMGDIRLPIFKNEKYIGPSVLIMLVSERCDIMWSPKILGRTDYLEGGISKQGRALRMKAPLGMAFRSLLFQRKDSGWKLRFTQSIGYYAYLKLAGVNAVGVEIERKCHPLWPLLTKPLGLILCSYWKHKYKK